MTKKKIHVVPKGKQLNAEQEINPTLRAWIDEVIVPILVRIWWEASAGERAA